MMINEAKANPIQSGFKLRFGFACSEVDILFHPFLNMTVIFTSASKMLYEER